MSKFQKYKSWIMAFVFVVAVLAVYKTFDSFYRVKTFLKVLSSSLMPFIVGFSIAYILNIPCNKINSLCKKSKISIINKGSKAISITTVYLILILGLYFGIREIVPEVSTNIVDLAKNVPTYIGDLITMISNFQEEHNIQIFQFDMENVQRTIQNIIGRLDLKELSKYAEGVVDVTANVIKFFIGIVVSVYMLIEKDKVKAAIKRFLHAFLKEEKSIRVIEALNKINNIFSKYLFCLLLDAIVMMFLASLTLTLLDVEYAIILGIMIGFFNLIPYFGSIIAVSITVITTLLTGDITQAFWVAISLLIVQQIDGNFIGPKIMGEMLKVSPLLIIFAVTLGGGLFGFVGMIVMVPFFITLKMACTQILEAREAKNAKMAEELEGNKEQ